MAGRTLAGSIGLTGDWDLGENNWKDANDLNLLKLSVLVQGRALDLVAATPGGPTEGDVYLFTDAHPTNPGDIAVYDEGAWTYITPQVGWQIWDADSGFWRQYDGTTWQEVTSGGGGSGGGLWWFNPPAAASFTLASGDGTNAILTDDADAGLLFDFGAYTSGDDNRFAYRTLTTPASDWELTIAFRALLMDSGIGFGIGIMDPTTSRVLTYLVRDTGWRMYNWSNLTSFDSIASDNVSPGGMSSRGLYWLKAKRVSGNILLQVSADGKQWFQIASIAISAYLTNSPARVGIIGNYATTTNRGYAAVEYFDLSGPAV